MSRIVDPRAWAALNPIREFVVHNATDEQVVITYDAETRWIPPVNQITYPHPKFTDTCHSAKDSNGDWIPGTLILRDVYNEKDLGEFGESRSLWSAANAIKHALGIDVRTGQADSDYAKRGLSVMPPNPEPETVAAIVADGRDRYEEWRIKQARETVDSYDDKNAARARVSMNPVPAGQDYHKAAAILKAYDEKQKRLAAESMASMELRNLPYEKAAPQAEPAPVVQETAAPSLREQVEALVNNPEAMKLLKDDYRMWPMQGKKVVA